MKCNNLNCLLLIIILSTILSSCSSDESDNGGIDMTTECNGVMATYSDDVAFIINTSCALSGCHNSTSRANGIDLSTYEKVKDESKNRRFLGAIRREPGFSAMPQGSTKLSDNAISTIVCWIENDHPQ